MLFFSTESPTGFSLFSLTISNLTLREMKNPMAIRSKNIAAHHKTGYHCEKYWWCQSFLFESLYWISVKGFYRVLYFVFIFLQSFSALPNWLPSTCSQHLTLNKQLSIGSQEFTFQKYIDYLHQNVIDRLKLYVISWSSWYQQC